MNTAGSVLLDTSVVIPHLRGDKILSARIAEVASIHIPWVVLGELLFGGQRAVRPQDALAQVRSFLRTVALLLPDRGHGRILRPSQSRACQDRQTNSRQ